MIYVTAAQGALYERSVTAMARSVTRYDPGANGVRRFDALQSGMALDKLGLWKFRLMLTAMDYCAAGETCAWVDADELVLAPLSTMMPEDKVAVIQHGSRPDDFMGGFFSIPQSRRDVLAYCWGLYDGAAASDGHEWKDDQEVLGVIRFAWPGRWVDLSQHEMLFTTKPMCREKEWHPKPGNPHLKEIELRNGSEWWWRDRRIALWSWVAVTLAEHLKEDFRSFADPIRRQLVEWYA